MKHVVIFSAFFISALAETVIKPSEQKPSGNRIIGGQLASDGQFPWQAGITYTRDDGALFFCGGALVDEQFVLTAANCATNAVSFDIFLGTATLNSNSEGAVRVTVGGENAIVHPEYNSSTFNYNVALIRLPEPLVSSVTLSPIRIPPPGERASAGLEVSVSGWGVTENSTSIVSQLRYVSQSVISNEDCASAYGNLVVVDSTVCSLGSDETQAPCNGDSGAPLVYLEEEVPTLHGTVSFLSSSGCDSGLPVGYVRTSTVTQWIDGVVIDYEDLC